jgi:hypothetical protein
MGFEFERDIAPPAAENRVFSAVLIWQLVRERLWVTAGERPGIRPLRDPSNQ